MFKVYGKTGCVYCTNVMEFLDEAGHKYEYVNIEESPEGMSFLKDNNFKTVPQVFHGDDPVGGFEDTMRYVLNL